MKAQVLVDNNLEKRYILSRKEREETESHCDKGIKKVDHP
jgi:hypothetical protein